MHRFLRAIGFSEVKTREQIKKLIFTTIEHATETECSVYSDDVLYCDMSLEVGENMGVTICGQYDELEEFQFDYYYPYMIASKVSSNQKSVVERHSANVSFGAVCEDNRIGISIIYYLQNRIQYMKKIFDGKEGLKDNPVCLSGLSDAGMIMMPLAKDENYQKKVTREDQKRDKLIEAARKGDEGAIESLTLKDIDVYSTISRKLKETDVYSIVDTYFMPYGIECDLYSVLAEIVSVKEVRNCLTNELVFQMQLLCNGVSIDICINKKDLFGEPEVGRRFKGTVWLQGWLDKLS